MTYPQLGAISEFRARDSLAQGCVVYAVGGREDLGNLARDVPAGSVIGGTGLGLTTVAAAHGPSVATNGTANGFLTFGAASDFSPGTGDFTVATLINPGSLINSFGLFVTGGVELLFTATAGSANWRFNGTNVNSGITFSGLNDGNHHLLLLTRVNGVCSYWADGNLVSTGTQATSLIATSPLTVGKRGSTATYYAIPGVGMTGYWNRALGEAEVLRLTADPFALIRALAWPEWVLKSTVGGSTQTLTPSLFTNSQTFYAPTVSRGAVTLAPSLFTNTQSFFAPTVAPGAVTLTPSLFSNSQTFYAPILSANYTLTPSLLTNSQTFYAATVSPGAVSLTPSLFTNGQTFFAPTVTQGSAGAQTLHPALLSNAQTFYDATVAPGAVALSPGLLTNAQAFYGASVTATYSLAPPLLTNAQVFYAPTVTPGITTLLPSLVANDNTFYAPTVILHSLFTDYTFTGSPWAPSDPSPTWTPTNDDDTWVPPNQSATWTPRA